jgi:dTDP-4-amino-4,6-dideoxygalactose transaminase
MFDKILEFEKSLADFVGAPYAISTDCCTHAIELCLRYEKIKYCEFTAFTYLSIPMTMHKLGIDYRMTNNRWVGEYSFEKTRIWDSARRLEPNMYRTGQMQCLSFGHSKPLDNGRGGAILLDDKTAYDAIIQMRYDGRNLNISPWSEQSEFKIGYHYKLNPEECISALEKLHRYKEKGLFNPVYAEYPDCRRIKIVE